jgi:hypothetical protein
VVNANERSIRFFYWAHEYTDLLRPLLDSAAANGIRLEPIGQGCLPRNFHNSLFKQRSLLEAVKALRGDEVVCATDGYDVFYQQGPEQVLDAFSSFGCDVVFSAERGYSHQYRNYKRFFDDSAGESPYRYLNAGSVIGYAWALKRVYGLNFFLKVKVAASRIRGRSRVSAMVSSWARVLGFNKSEESAFYLSWPSYTDQALLGKRVARGLPGIAIELDRACKLFWCSALEYDEIEKHYSICEGKIRNQHTGTVPAMVHVPWPEKRPVFDRLYTSVYGADATSKSFRDGPVHA